MGEINLRTELDQIFGAFVRQETLESAAEEMAAISKADPTHHTLFASALSQGIEAARAGDATICQSIEWSGYYAPSTKEAEEILVDLQQLYLTKFEGS